MPVGRSPLKTSALRVGGLFPEPVYRRVSKYGVLVKITLSEMVLYESISARILITLTLRTRFCRESQKRL
jgi:hypothetical protein